MPGELIAFLKDFQHSYTHRKKETLLQSIGHLFDANNLMNAVSIAEIFSKIAPAMTFLDYGILEHIIDVYGEGTDMPQKLAQYKDDLTEFLRSCKAPHSCKLKIPRTDSESAVKHNQTQMCFKLKSVNMSEYREFKQKIAKLFDVAEDAIVLISIEEGCVELVFLFPKIVIEDVLPLAPSKKS